MLTSQYIKAFIFSIRESSRIEKTSIGLISIFLAEDRFPNGMYKKKVIYNEKTYVEKSGVKSHFVINDLERFFIAEIEHVWHIPAYKE